MKTTAVVLAAGKGVRMCSDLPKVVHCAAGKPMILHVIDAVRMAGIEEVCAVIGHGREKVMEVLAGQEVKYAVQEQQLGTGHALIQAEQQVNPQDTILVLSGDTPLLQGETLRQLLNYHKNQQAIATVLSATIDDSFGYGRIVRRPDGSLENIVEERDASEEQKLIKEINTGIYCFQGEEVFRCLSGLNTSNAQGEYYLTQVLEILLEQNKKVSILQTDQAEDIQGVNDRVQLAEAEAVLRKRKNRQLMLNGVTITDPASTFIDCEVTVGKETIILPFTILEGRTGIGTGCTIGPSTRISDSILGSRVTIEYSRVTEATIGNDCKIGPFAYLRPQAILRDNVKVGDFVEIKNSTIGTNSKVPHLSYVGDAVVGSAVNIGAGTITCNYDGKNKYPTYLEDGCFIGSNTNLVAPVRIGCEAVTGAGSTITRDVPAHSLAVERARQKNLPRRGNQTVKDDTQEV